MEMGKAMADPDAFGVEAAAGEEEVEARLMLAGSSLKPGGRAAETWKRDTPVAMLAGTGVRGAPHKTGVVATGTGPTPRPPVGRTLGRGGMLEGWAMGAEVFPSESRKAVRSSLGSGGRGGMILIQVLGTFSRVCC